MLVLTMKHDVNIYIVGQLHQFIYMYICIIYKKNYIVTF